MEALIFLRFIALAKIKEYNSLEDLLKFVTCNLHKLVINSLNRMDGGRMIYIALSLIAGFLVGFKSKINEKMVKVNSTIQTLCLVLLIFVMGMGIGMNKEVLNNLSTLGLKAILFAVISSVGSVLVVYLFSFVLEKKED